MHFDREVFLLSFSNSCTKTETVWLGTSLLFYRYFNVSPTSYYHNFRFDNTRLFVVNIEVSSKILHTKEEPARYCCSRQYICIFVSTRVDKGLTSKNLFACCTGYKNTCSGLKIHIPLLQKVLLLRNGNGKPPYNS